MGLLDELEDEAQRRKSNDEDLVALKAARELSYRKVLEPAMGNLFAAVRNRAADAGFDRETMHQIADILDEAARKVERL